MDYVYLVCAGDVEGHETLSAWIDEDEAIKEATKQATKAFGGPYTRDDNTMELSEIALWVRDDGRLYGRIFGYVCVERHEVNG